MMDAAGDDDDGGAADHGDSKHCHICRTFKPADQFIDQRYTYRTTRMCLDCRNQYRNKTRKKKNVAAEAEETSSAGEALASKALARETADQLADPKSTPAPEFPCTTNNKAACLPEALPNRHSADSQIKVPRRIACITHNPDAGSGSEDSSEQEDSQNRLLFQEHSSPAMPSAAKGEWELPRLRLAFTFKDDSRFFSTPAEFFDVKFYPYNPIGAPPVFAAISKKHVIVCRLTEKDAYPCEVISAIRDDDPEASLAGCCWSCDVETETPWLCVAGDDAKIKVYDVRERKLVKTLVGHGAGINDLTTSPDDPSIIASGSEDFTVRLWSLKPEHAKQPCISILGGEGHSWDLLTVAFHDTGRYLLSAGHDQVINLWVVPDIPAGHVDTPVVVHYPHFFTQEIHKGLVDCVAFFGDLVLSRACHENTIALWRIDGFNSEDAPPSRSQAPTTYDTTLKTRSAFVPVVSAAEPTQYTRLLQFATADCGVQFFMRFRLFHEANKHPILAFCNAKSKIFFWDLERLTAYRQFMRALDEAKETEKGTYPERPGWLQVKKGKKEPAKGTAVSLVRARDKDSHVSPSPDPDAAAGQPYSQKTLQEWAELYDISNPIHELLPHRTVQATSSTESTFVGRQVGWSPGGQWCVVVGSGNRAVLCQRWATTTPGG